MIREAASVVFCLAVLGAGNALSLGIIWHEQNAPEVKRTLVNRLVSNGAGWSVLFSQFGLLTTAAMAGVGDLPETFCDISMVVLNFAFVGYLANMDVIVILRYLYVCRFRTVGAFNDDLVYAFATAWTVGLSAYLVVLHGFFDQHRIPFWHKCKRCSVPDEDLSASVSKLAFYAYAAGVATVLHAVLYTRINLHKRRLAAAASAATTTVENRQLQVQEQHQQEVQGSNFVSLGTSVALLLLAVVAIAATGFVFIFYNDDLDDPVGSCPPAIVMMIAFLDSILVQGAYYYKNGEMRQKVLAAAREAAVETRLAKWVAAQVHAMHE